MTAQGRSCRFVILGTAIALIAPFVPGNAEAARHSHPASSHGGALHHGPARFSARWHGGPVRGHWRQARVDYGTAGGGISCVPFARENSGIELAGNAATWWSHAAGVYARGNQPEVGSVLNFRATGRMRLGHVAVVTDVIGPRAVEIDHANWASRGSVSHGIRVEDVSPANDWTAVRVALANGEFGSVYPTYGFIYDRPDNGGVMLANAQGMPATAQPAGIEEVAELPDASEPRLARGSHSPRLQADEARRHRHRHYHHRHYHG